MSIKENIKDIELIKKDTAEKIGKNTEEILLIAVTKLHTAEEINEAIDAGITDIGENKVQELISKYDLVKPVKWHLIGHLQTNKVKYIIDKVSMIHSLDSLKLAKEINKQAKKFNLVMDVLIQVNIANEESKYGIDEAEIGDLINQIRETCTNVRIKGLMCIPPRTNDMEDSRVYFKKAKCIFEKCRAYKQDDVLDFQYLSMGMSNDYPVAIEEGSNIIRVGTSIFGQRDYRSEEK